MLNEKIYIYKFALRCDSHILYIESLVVCVRASVCDRQSATQSVCDRQSVTVSRESQISRSLNPGPEIQVLKPRS
jgi:hypothetical protein